MVPVRRIAAAGVLAVAAGALGAGLPAGPAGAVAGSHQSFRVPPNAVFTLRGHGWGHGHGMSQYGAYGAAKVKDLTYQQIVAFYYPGTSLAGQPLGTTVRVLLHDTSQSRLIVAPRGKAAISASSDGVPDCVLPATVPDKSTDGGTAPVLQWRARMVSTPDGDRLQLGATTDGTTWRHVTIAGCDPAWSAPIDGSITFDGDGGITDLVRSSGVAAYRGAVRAAFTGTHIFVVNDVKLDSYLLSVVPSEMPSSWAPAALQAQAVAARTYASYEIAHPKNKQYYDVYDDTRDQVYGGVAHEAASSTAAVKATEDAQAQTGDVLDASGGGPAFTQFSSSDGGWTVSGGQPYLPAQRDPYDGLVPSSVHTWSATVSAAAIEAVYGADIGRLRSIVVNGRDGHGQWGGRITSLVLNGSAGSLTVTGFQFRYALGLRSEWFTVIPPPAPPTEVTASVSGNVAAVGWQPPPSAQGAAVTGYRVVVNPGGQTTTVGADARTATVSGLQDGTDYTASVVALSDSGPGWPTTVTTKVHRITASDRVATAVAVSQATFRDGKAGAVVLARRTGPIADSFAAAPLSAVAHAPVLLTGRTSVPTATTAELRRVLPAGGTVYLLGPTTAIDDSVRQAIHGMGFRVVRRDGATPAAVARAVAHTVARSSTVTAAFEVDVSDAASAWVAGAAAAHRHGVVLLTKGGALAPETASWLSRHGDVKRFAVGAAAAAADSSAVAFTGPDPASVASALAARFFPAPGRTALVISGDPNAGLVAATRLAVTSGPLLYADGAVSTETASYIKDARMSLGRVDLIGNGLPYDDIESGVQQALLGKS